MSIAESLNIKKNCSQYRVGLWECPQFLFVLMGIVICAAIFATYIIGQRFYDEPQMVALIALIVAAVLFIIGHIIVASFERIAKASRAKSEFISIMSHELRSPLSAIKWQVDVLLSDKPSSTNMPPETEKYLKTIDEQNERMIRSVNDLLEVNKIEDKDLTLRPVLFSLEDLTRRAVKKNQDYASSNKIKIRIDILGNDTTVFADEEKIKRAIEHLIDNAIRYSAPEKTIKITVEKKESMVRWEIANSGMGIMPEDRKRIFEKFFRSVNTAKYRTEGAGVGLFIVKSIITLSGGSIGFTSSLDNETVFWVFLPAAK